MLAVMETGGIDKVSALTPQSFCLGIHGVHEGIHAAADLLRQDIARLVGGDDQHALQQLLHRQDLPCLDAGGAAVRRKPLHGALRGGDLLVQGQLPAVHCLQHQQGSHDLGKAGGVHLLMLVFAVHHPPGVGIHQQHRLTVQLRGRDAAFLVRGGRRGKDQAGHQDQQEKKREKAACFHIKLL